MDGFIFLDVDISSMDDVLESTVSFNASVHASSIDSVRWHSRLGHIGQDRMPRLAREGLLDSLARVDLPICESCLQGRQPKNLLARLKGHLFHYNLFTQIFVVP